MDGENKYKTATAAYGDKFVAPEAPEKDGFTFVGWFTDKECTKEFDFNTAVSDTVTVYAKWEANQRGCGSVAAVSASAAAAVLLLTVAAVALAKKEKSKIIRKEFKVKIAPPGSFPPASLVYPMRCGTG